MTEKKGISLFRGNDGNLDAVLYRGAAKIPGGQLERLRKAGAVTDEHGDDWAERRARIAG